LPEAATSAKAHGVARLRSRFGILAYGVVLAGGTLVCVFVGLVALYTVAPPVSILMLGRMIEGKNTERIYVRLKNVAPAAVAAVIASEDARFCENDGVEWGVLSEVMNEADAGAPRRGASTITMQTAKNLFLWPGRSVIRKGIEIGVALVLGKVWSKARTIEVYLNIAEWGDGLFGIEAAARRYFRKGAGQLDAREGALLAISLPNPIKRDPARPSPFQRRLAGAVEVRALNSSELLNCLRR
jgi:monofunctional biosynthetic peptidoglycan transglycosylase